MTRPTLPLAVTVAVALACTTCRDEPASAPPPREVTPDVAATASPPGAERANLGAACIKDTECVSIGPTAYCLKQSRGFPGGACTLPCPPECPSGAACTDGHCLPACTTDSPSCRSGYVCTIAAQTYPPTPDRPVCLPSEPVEPRTECQKDLEARGVRFEAVRHPLQRAGAGPDLVCDVAEPVLLIPSMHGVELAFVGKEPTLIYADCRLAVALDELAKRAAAMGVRRINHIGTYNCRTIRNRAALSLHARALAIDIHSVVLSDGSDVSIKGEWEHPRGKVLRDLAHELHRDFVFNIVLTPDYNEGHRDHLHLDLSEDRHFMEVGKEEFLLGED